MAQRPIPCSVMRGGTSKALVFHARDLPESVALRDAVLLAAMGSPDPREIDGMGGAHPLTSKVAVVGPSTHPAADIDYLFLQVWPDRAEVSDGQGCGNILAAVGPYALEEGLLAAGDPLTDVRIFMQNTDSLAVAHLQTPDGLVTYEGDARIDGVPGTHAPVPIDFLDVAGSTCGVLLPTKSARDEIDGVEVTCVDNGMPVVCLKAGDLDLSGYESPVEIEADKALRQRIEAIRLAAGPLMQLGDVAHKTVPKMCLLAPPLHGGALTTRTFIPHRVHEAIGVFGAVSVATACLVEGSVAAEVAVLERSEGALDVEVEHPSGFFTVSMDVKNDGGEVTVQRAALLRTARLLMRGEVFVPSSLWPA